MKKFPIVIVEGIDGAGKSTIAAKLAKALHAYHVHHGVYQNTDKHYLANVFHTSMLPALYNYAPVVLDRAWYSEPIYGAVFRGGVSRLTLNNINWLESERCKVPSLVVVLHLTLDEAWAAVQSRLADELPQQRAQLQTLHSMYAAAAWPDGTLHLDRRDNTADALSAIILRAANAAVAAA